MTSRFQHVVGVSGRRFVVSVLFGAAFYLAWMAFFLASSPYHSPLFRGLLWIVAPIVTALGFSAGAAFCIRFRRLPHPPFRHLCLYPLTGCSIGAAVVFPFGPMLIVFGMCLLGALSMLVFEVVDFRRFAAGTQANLDESQRHGG